MDIETIKKEKEIVLKAIDELSPITIPEISQFTKLSIDKARQWVLHFHSNGEIASAGTKLCSVTQSRLPAYKIRDAHPRRISKQVRSYIER
jgi:hypothetical protein